MERKNKNQYLRVFILGSLICSILVFNSYGQTSAPQDDMAEQGESQEQEHKEKPKDKEAFYGNASIELANNANTAYPASTELTPSLIIMKKQDYASTLAFDGSLKLGFEKFFTLEEKRSKILVEIGATPDKANLSMLYFQRGIFSMGLRKNNFCNVSAAPLPIKALQLGWTIPFADHFEYGISLEEAKELDMYHKGIKEEDKRPLKSTKQLPALSTRLNYSLPDKLGEVELSGLVRPLVWYTPFGNKPGDVTNLGFGLNLGTKLDVQKNQESILTLNGLWGQGIGSYVQDVSSLENEEHSVYVVEKDKVKILGLIGGHVNFEQKLAPQITLNFGGGVNKMLNVDKNNRPDAYGLGAYGFGNVQYALTEKIDVGGEYRLGMRQNAAEGRTKGASQIKVFASFSFRTETEAKNLQI